MIFIALAGSEFIARPQFAAVVQARTPSATLVDDCCTLRLSTSGAVMWSVLLAVFTFNAKFNHVVDAFGSDIALVPSSSASLVAGTRRASSASLVAGIRRASSAPLVAQLIQIFALTRPEFIAKTQLASVVQARTLFVTLFNDFCTFAKSQI